MVNYHFISKVQLLVIHSLLGGNNIDQSVKENV
jgi:hypothetical protein